MSCELFLQVSAIPPVAELIEVALQVPFAELMISSEEGAFGVRSGQAEAWKLLILERIGYVAHFDVVIE